MKNKFLRDRIYVIETNIDDMSPVIYETVFEKLYEAGALEVFLTPVQMKKIRPGVLLTVLTQKNKLEKIAEVIFRETTSFGIRYHETKRLKLFRRTVGGRHACPLRVGKKCGDIKVNKGYIGKELIKVSPEYADCLKAASKKRLALKDIL